MRLVDGRRRSICNACRRQFEPANDVIRPLRRLRDNGYSIWSLQLIYSRWWTRTTTSFAKTSSQPRFDFVETRWCQVHVHFRISTKQIYGALRLSSSWILFVWSLVAGIRYMDSGNRSFWPWWISKHQNGDKVGGLHRKCGLPSWRNYHPFPPINKKCRSTRAPLARTTARVATQSQKHILPLYRWDEYDWIKDVVYDWSETQGDFSGKTRSTIRRCNCCSVWRLCSITACHGCTPILSSQSTQSQDLPSLSKIVQRDIHSGLPSDSTNASTRSYRDGFEVCYSPAAFTDWGSNWGWLEVHAIPCAQPTAARGGKVVSWRRVGTVSDQWTSEREKSENVGIVAHSL